MRKSTKPRRKGKRRLYCDCGRPAVAKAVVRVGLDGVHTVTLLLCRDCLALERTLPCAYPPVAVIYL